MEYAVYSPAHNTSAYVLTPRCMRPSFAMERKLGPMLRRAIVAIDDELLPVLTGRAEVADAEFLVTETFARRYVGRLVERTFIAPVGPPDP